MHGHETTPRGGDADEGIDAGNKRHKMDAERLHRDPPEQCAFCAIFSKDTCPGAPARLLLLNAIGRIAGPDDIMDGTCDVVSDPRCYTVLMQFVQWHKIHDRG